MVSTFTEKQISEAISFWTKKQIELNEAVEDNSVAAIMHQGMSLKQWEKEFNGEFTLQQLQRMAFSGTDFQKLVLTVNGQPSLDDSENQIAETMMTAEEFYGEDEEKPTEETKIEETAPGGKYEPNTVGAVMELLKRSDPNDILFIREAQDKSARIIVDISRKITMDSGITYMEVAPGDPTQM